MPSKTLKHRVISEPNRFEKLIRIIIKFLLTNAVKDNQSVLWQGNNLPATGVIMAGKKLKKRPKNRHADSANAWMQKKSEHQNI